MDRGKVVLVGAGPGDPGLLTVKGKEMLQAADVVVYDRLVCEKILEYAPHAKKIDVGKEQGNHPVPQHQINEILLHEAKQPGLIVRLKGGDPYLFGRGAEEAETLAQHNIPFEVVPGVTSALSAPAYAGIPATLRGAASSVHIITGHAKAGSKLEIDFEALYKTKGTLIFLMSVGSMPAITAGLLSAGMASSTLAGIVENGTLPQQRKILGTVGTIAALGKQKKVQSPAVLVVGEVCAMADTLDWRSSLPLYKKTVVVTRPKQRAGTLSKKLRALGAHVVELPCIEANAVAQEDIKKTVEKIPLFNWVVFTSPQGVQSFFEAIYADGGDARILSPVKIAAVGAGTARELKKYGICADLIPQKYDAAHLAQELVTALAPGEKVLLLRAQRATDVLPEVLAQHAVFFEDVAIYATSAVKLPDNLKEAECLLHLGKVDYVTFTSASTVEGFSACLPDVESALFTAVCIGDATQKAAQGKGYKTIEAKNATVDCLLEAILEECK